MTKRHPVRQCRGYTIYELLVAIVLLAIAVHPVILMLSSNVQMATDRDARGAALLLLRNEVSLLASADPFTVDPHRAYAADRSGHANPAGAYLVRTTRNLRCGGGGGVIDNTAAPPPGGCASGVVADYRVTVAFRRHAGSRTNTTLTHGFSVAARGGSIPGGDLP